MKRFLLSLLALAAFPALLHANGDPVISYSAAIRSSNPIPLKVTQVQVAREDLNIKVMLPYTEVSVVYRLRNASAEPIHVDYGFPVDFNGYIGQNEGFEESEYSESLFEKGVDRRAVRDIRFRLDGKELPWTHSDEFVVVDQYIDEESGNMVYYNQCRLWTYTVLDIPAGATVTLEVGYSVLSNWTTALGSLRGSPLSRYYPSDGDISYDFTPAQYWGNGKADEVSLTVDCSALPKGFLSDGSPSVGMGERSGNVWKLTKKNFDFAAEGMLGVSFWKEYGDPDATYPSWGDPLNRLAVPAADYQLAVSGAQAKYPASNLLDGNLSTAWVAPGDGVGAALELTFPQPRRVSDLVLYNGYHKSAPLWSGNSRIKRMKVEITRADGYEESFETGLAEDMEWWQEHSYMLYESLVPRFGVPVLVNLTSIQRMLYGREAGSDEDGIIEYCKVPADAEKISRIRLTVLEVTPGTQYKDLCLSEISVLDGFTILE